MYGASQTFRGYCYCCGCCCCCCLLNFLFKNGHTCFSRMMFILPLVFNYVIIVGSSNSIVETQTCCSRDPCKLPVFLKYHAYQPFTSIERFLDLALICIYACVGELPVPVVCLFSSWRCSDRGGLDLTIAGPGFTLPTDIVDFDPAITQLNLSRCNLIGDFFNTNLVPARLAMPGWRVVY